MFRTYKFWITTLFTFFIAGCASNYENADLVITNAKIFTSDKQQPWAEALAVRDGEFIFVGDSKGIELFQSSTVFDLNGKMIIPGMVDGHAHPGYVNIESFRG